jgi:hypothetical protein
MNVNNIMNIYIAGLLRGDMYEKETTMVERKVVEGTWNGGANFHRNRYRIWTSLAQRTKSGSLAPN